MEKMLENPFGTFRPPFWARFLIAICQNMPVNWLGKRIAFLLRKPILLSKQSPIDVKVQGACFRLQPKTNLSDKRLLCTPNLLDGRERRLMADRLDKGGCLIDVGANIGGYGLLLSAAREDLKILAVEPDPELVNRLTENIRFSGFSQRVQVLQAAVTGTTGPVTLKRDRDNRGKNAIVEAGQKLKEVTDTIEVHGMTLLAIMNKYHIQRPDAVKLDIEGHELSVLKIFFEQASKERWPKFIQLEQHRKHELNEVVHLAMHKGYRLLKRTRMNVILALV